MEKLFTFWDTPECENVHSAECMQQLLEKVRHHKVNIDGNVCTVMVTTLVLEVISLTFFVHLCLTYHFEILKQITIISLILKCETLPIFFNEFFLA